MGGQSRNLPFEYLERYAQLGEVFEPELTDSLIQKLEQRDRDLEDFLASLGSGLGEIIIDFGDYILVGTSKAFTPRRSATLTSVFARLFVADAVGPDPVILEILKNGTVIGELQIPAGDAYAEVDVDVQFAALDAWQMRVTDTGTGGAGLLVQGNFR